MLLKYSLFDINESDYIWMCVYVRLMCLYIYMTCNMLYFSSPTSLSLQSLSSLLVLSVTTWQFLDDALSTNINSISSIKNFITNYQKCLHLFVVIELLIIHSFIHCQINYWILCVRHWAVRVQHRWETRFLRTH